MTEKLEAVDEELEKIAVATVPSLKEVAVKKAKEALREGNELLNKRQKLIQLADWSEYGWDLVPEYDVKELVEDSDDEKKIAKAERQWKRGLSKRKSNLQGGSRSRQVAPCSDWCYGSKLPAANQLPQTQNHGCQEIATALVALPT